MIKNSILKSQISTSNLIKLSKIFIVTVNWNNYEDTIDLLDSIKKLKERSYQIQTTIVDNGSTNNSVEILLKSYPNIKIIKSKVNLGFAGGFNLGLVDAKRNGADYILIINNDTIIQDTDFLNKLIRVFEKYPNTGLVAPKIYFQEGFEYHKERYCRSKKGKVIWYAGGIIDWKNILFKHNGVDEIDNGQYDDIKETPFCTGCAILIKGDVLKKVGLFDEEYFAYLEDVDLNIRTKRAGYNLMYTGTTSISHKTSRSSGGSGSAFHDYFITRNRIIFGLKYASIRTILALFREAIKLFFSGRPYQKLGVRDFFFGVRGKGSFFKYYKG